MSAINNVNVMGRITKDLELKQSQGPNGAKSHLNFTVAVNRSYKDNNGNVPADFILCSAFGKTAEFIAKYFGKGRMIAIRGEIQTSSYTDKATGQQRSGWCVVVSEAAFTGEKNDNAQNTVPAPQQPQYQQVPPQQYQTPQQNQYQQAAPQYQQTQQYQAPQQPQYQQAVPQYQQPVPQQQPVQQAPAQENFENLSDFNFDEDF